MSYKFNCPHCNLKVEADDSLKGEVVECPDCNKNITVPDGTETPDPTIKKKKITPGEIYNSVILPIVNVAKPKIKAAISLGKKKYSESKKIRISVISIIIFIIALIVIGSFGKKDMIIPNLGMKLVYVAPGSFKMGSNDGKSDEKPVHRVTLTKGYWIGKYEVTQSEYESIMDTNPSRFKGGNKPVEKVNWLDAIKFCKKLTSRERTAGRLPSNCEYRLPTEAEWEFAARGGTKSQGYKYSGSDSIDSVAWYRTNSFMIHDVGTKSANELGIHDMSGNVFEWCNDRFEKYSSTSVTDPTVTSFGYKRVSRGGCWDSTVGYCRSTGRAWSSSFARDDRAGFRLLRTVSK